MTPPQVPTPWRLAALGFVSFLLYLVGHMWQAPLSRVNQPLYVLWFSAVLLWYLVALLDTRRHDKRPHPAVVPIIVGWAIVFRLAVLWITPGFLSDDIYRYVWDGRVQQAGINPYVYPPAAPELAFLRDGTIYPMINRQGALTIYPPGAQLFFRLMAWMGPGDLVAMKALILLADMASIALLLQLCKRLDIPRTHVLLYAWHPLVIVELGISGHLDGLMIPFVLLAFLWLVQGRPWLVGAALGTATLIKLYPALLLPVLYRRRDWPPLVVFFGVVGLGYLLYLDAGFQIFGYLPHYLAPDEFYNLSLRPVMMWLVGRIATDPFPYVKGISAAIWLLAMLQCVRHPDKSPQQAVQWGIGLITLYLVLVSPSVFQWYLVWLLALVTLTPGWLTPVWLYWSWSVYLDYLAWLPLFTSARPWLRIAEYAPVLLGIIGYWWWLQARRPLAIDAPRRM